MLDQAIPKAQPRTAAIEPQSAERDAISDIAIKARRLSVEGFIWDFSRKDSPPRSRRSRPAASGRRQSCDCGDQGDGSECATQHQHERSDPRRDPGTSRPGRRELFRKAARPSRTGHTEDCRQQDEPRTVQQDSGVVPRLQGVSHSQERHEHPQGRHRYAERDKTRSEGEIQPKFSVRPWRHAASVTDSRAAAGERQLLADQRRTGQRPVRELTCRGRFRQSAVHLSASAGHLRLAVARRSHC